MSMEGPLSCTLTLCYESRKSAFFGYSLDILLYGVLTVQTYLYYLGFPGDKWRTKTIVLFVYAIGTLQTAFALHDFYSLFGMPLPSDNLTLSRDFHFFGYMWFVVPISSALVAAVAQFFYAHRIYTVSENKFITSLVVVVLAFIQLCCGILTAAVSYSHFGNLVGRFVDALAWESVGGICDLIIAIYMFRFLSVRIQQSFRSMKISLTKLKQLILETGLLTTITAIAYVILSYTTRYAFMIPGVSISKIYSNSILVLLNNRFTIPGGRDTLDSELEFDQFTTHQLQTAGQDGIPLESLANVGENRPRDVV